MSSTLTAEDSAGCGHHNADRRIPYASRISFSGGLVQVAVIVGQSECRNPPAAIRRPVSADSGFLTSTHLILRIGLFYMATPQIRGYDQCTGLLTRSSLILIYCEGGFPMGRIRSQMIIPLICGVLVLSLNLLVLPPAGRADEFTIIDEKGQESTIAAELVGSDDQWHALALADGQYKIVPQAAVRKRVPMDGPTPLTPQQMADELQAEYGAELFRYDILGNYVVGIVLATPLPKTSEGRIKKVLDRATSFMKKVETAFATFLKEAKITANKPKYPQVMLIFETDIEFEKYTEKITQQRGLQASMIAGFYSGLTNFLAIRLEECSSFETPFHEAIHQQVYNCGLLQRLSPVPQWFDEGIATGFEGATGKVVPHPIRISPRYARQSLQHDNMSWEEMHLHDEAFRGDVLVSEAYGQAWGLHWLLITKYKAEYNKYLKLLSQKPPLGDDNPEERKADFAAAFKKPMSEMEREFPQVLELAIKKQKVVSELPKPAGISMTESNLGKVQMTAIQGNGILRVEGQLFNMSPLRPMSFLVMVATDAGNYALWFQDKVEIGKSVQLPAQAANQRLPGANGFGTGRTFRVLVRSAPSDSPYVAEWRSQRGNSVLEAFSGRRKASAAGADSGANE